MGELVKGLEIGAEVTPVFSEILTPEAWALVVKLEQTFGERRRELLALRDQRQLEIDGGKMPDFLPETAHIRESEWTVAPIPADLNDRRVEIEVAQRCEADVDLCRWHAAATQPIRHAQRITRAAGEIESRPQAAIVLQTHQQRTGIRRQWEAIHTR